PHAAVSRDTASTHATCARFGPRPAVSRRCSSSWSPPGSARATWNGGGRRSTTSRRSPRSRQNSHSTFSSATSGRRPNDDHRRAQGPRARRAGLPAGRDRVQGPDAADRQRRGIPLDGGAPRRVGGAEARGFIFGGALAYELGCGFVPARKPGKLPWEKIRATYELEYGSDSLEIHADAFSKGARVIVLDDVLATGGTAQAKVELVENLGGEV